MILKDLNKAWADVEKRQLVIDGEIREYIEKTGGMHGSKTPAQQLHIRQLNAQKRMVHREFTANYVGGPTGDRAKAELAFIRPDTGELLELGTRKHGVGRLDCPACQTTVGTGKDALLPISVPMTSICANCNRGVQHTYQAAIPVSAVSGAGVPMGKALLTSPGPNLEGVTTRFELRSQCDNCNSNYKLTE